MTIVRVSLGILFLFLSACSSVVIENHVDGKALTKNAGVLVVGLHSDWENYKGPVAYQLALSFIGNGDSSYVGRELVFQGANYYSVIELPANTYHIEEQRHGMSVWNFDKGNQFKIKPNTITYIGDITSNLRGNQDFSIDDKFRKAKQYLSKHYSHLLEKNKLEKKIIALKFQNR